MQMANCYQSHGYAILQDIARRKNVIGETIDMILEHAVDCDWNTISRSFKILEEGFKKKEPYTNDLMDMVVKEGEKMFRRDCIYYTICSDGFRL